MAMRIGEGRNPDTDHIHIGLSEASQAKAGAIRPDARPAQQPQDEDALNSTSELRERPGA